MLRLTFAAALGLVLAGCGGERASAPGGVTPPEAEALEDAAKMLDERRLAPEALVTDAPTPTPAPAEMTGDRAPTGG
jgi:hypothetical protein